MLNKTSLDSSLEKINDAVLTQSIFGRMFGFGDLEILTASEIGDQQVPHDHRPDRVQEGDARREARVRARTWRGGFRPAPPIRDEADAAVTGGDRDGRRDGRDGRAAGRRRRRRAATRAPRPGRPRRGDPDARAPRRPARPRRDQRRGVRGARRRTCSAGSSGYHTRDPSRGAAWTRTQLIPIVIVVAILLLVGFPVHEFAHAFAAYRLGDGTAKLFGRLTLNPIVHFDPLGGILLAASFLASRARSASAGPSRRRSTRTTCRAAARARRSSPPPGPSRTWSWRSPARIPLRYRAREPGDPAQRPDRHPGAGPVRADQHRPDGLQPDPDPAARRLARSCSPPSTGRPSTRSGRSSSSTGSSILHRVFFLPPGHSVGSQVLFPDHRLGSMASWWAGKVRQFRAHLRASVSPGRAGGPGGLADPGAARAVRLDARRRPAPRPRRRRLAARRRRDGPRPAARRPAPRRRQGRHRHLAAGRVLARPALRDVGLGRAPVGCRASGRRSSGCATHAETSAALALGAGCSARTVELIRYQDDPRDPVAGERLRLADEAN